MSPAMLPRVLTASMIEQHMSARYFAGTTAIIRRGCPCFESDHVPWSESFLLQQLKEIISLDIITHDGGIFYVIDPPGSGIFNYIYYFFLPKMSLEDTKKLRERHQAFLYCFRLLYETHRLCHCLVFLFS